MISIYPIGDELYAFAEAPFIHQIDPVTLETTGRVNNHKNVYSLHCWVDSLTNCFMLKENLKEKVNLMNQSSHPHVTNNGVYHLGQTIGAKGPFYVIVHYPPPLKEPNESIQSNPSIEKACVISRIPCRSRKEPSYMHSFSITESYFVLIEQPLSVSLKAVLGSMLMGKPLVNALKWRPRMVTFFSIFQKCN